MSKKLSIGVVPLFAALALAVTPMAAQATPHWYSNGLGSSARILPEEVVPTIAWGTLSLTNLTTGGKVTCHNVVGGTLENPAPGGATGPAGIAETQSFNPYNCESEACNATATGGGPATYISVFAEGTEVPYPNTGTGHMTAPNVSTEEPLAASGTNLRWKNHLSSATGKIRLVAEGVVVNVICHVMTGLNAKGEPEFGVQVSEISKGSNEPLLVTHCCSAKFPPELEFDAASGTLTNEKAQKGKTEGNLKSLGYNEQEVINGKEN